MKYETAWQLDGSLRDICVLKSTIADWQRVFDWLRGSPYPIEFKVNGRISPLPEKLDLVFMLRKNVDVSASINLNGVIAKCYFFTAKEIEFDIDPSEVDSDDKEEAVEEFMKGIGRLLCKEVILTFSSWHVAVFLRYSPQQAQIEYTPITFTESEPISREEAFKMMARVYGVNENDEQAVIKKMLEAANRPAYEDD